MISLRQKNIFLLKKKELTTKRVVCESLHFGEEAFFWASAVLLFKL